MTHRPTYYRRDGTFYEGSDATLQWAADFEKTDLKRVRHDVLPNGKRVSTVWLGLDHNFGDGPPLIFETMVFPDEDCGDELDCERYSTEAEAIAGHERMVTKWRV